jgi:hypothetical protein
MGQACKHSLVAVAVGQQDHPTRERTDPWPLIVNVSISVTLPESASLSRTLVLLILFCE